MPNYGDPKYWEDRYNEQKDITYDWLEDYESLKPIIADFQLDKGAKIINLGCGNSEFCEDMYDNGYHNIHNIDICENVIQNMRERNKQREKMIFEAMDVCNLKYEDNSFDLAIDKSTIDALLCGDNSFINVAIMTKEIQRILKVGGIYMMISYGQPENRTFHLQREHLSFDISIYTIRKDSSNEDGEESEKCHYVYIMRKLPNANEIMQLNFQKVYEELENQEYEEDEEADIGQGEVEFGDNIHP